MSNIFAWVTMHFLSVLDLGDCTAGRLWMYFSHFILDVLPDLFLCFNTCTSILKLWSQTCLVFKICLFCLVHVKKMKLSFQEWTQQVQEMLNTKKFGDIAFRDKDFKTAIDYYSKVSTSLFSSFVCNYGRRLSQKEPSHVNWSQVNILNWLGPRPVSSRI